MSIANEKLMAFADGELDAAARAEIEAALAQDPTLRAKVDAHQIMRSRLSAAFDGALSEPVPEKLRTATHERPPAEIVDFAARRNAKWSAREWGAIAASIALGLVVGVGATRQPQPMIATAENGMVARGALTRALDTQLAADAAGPVRIGVSFRNQEGEYCRTFDLTTGGASGVACREANAWVIPLMSGSATGGEVRTAGASSDILNAVDAMIAGEPLGANAERSARDSGWR